MSKEKVLAWMLSHELRSYPLTKTSLASYSFTTAAIAAPTSIPHALPSIFMEST